MPNGYGFPLGKELFSVPGESTCNIKAAGAPLHMEGGAPAAFGIKKEDWNDRKNDQNGMTGGALKASV